MLSDEEAQKLRSKLKNFYIALYEKIATCPLDQNSLQDLKDVFVELVLLDDKNSEQEICYEEFLNMLKNTQDHFRMALIGEAGVGKTTLLAKIAHDWATDNNDLTHIQFLFMGALRDAKDSSYFHDILLKYPSTDIQFEEEKINNYIEMKGENVLFLLDGLDEYSGDITEEDSNNYSSALLRGDKFPRSKVVVTTRPWRADQITSVQSISDKYVRILVKGFSKDTVEIYIKKFFRENEELSTGLNDLMREDSLVANNVTPYPIFCCMLCHLWRENPKKDSIQEIKTFSQLFDKMIHSLIEQLASKSRRKGPLVNKKSKELNNLQERCFKCFKRVGKIALDGLLKHQLTFAQETFKDCPEDLKTCFAVGVLSSEKRLTPDKDTGKESSEHAASMIPYCFPHKLFQEYLAGLYLASLYHEAPVTFQKFLKDELIPKYEQFKYLLYFTAAHGKGSENAGKKVMDVLCSHVKNEMFISEVAFECHDKDSIAPATEFFKKKSLMELIWSSHQKVEHTWSGFKYTLGAVGQQMVSIYQA